MARALLVCGPMGRGTGRIRHRWGAAWVAAAVMAVAAPALAQIQVDPPPAGSDPERWLSAVRLAEAAVDATLADQRDLERQIRAEKETGADRSDRLQGLLRRSLDAESALADAVARLQTVREAAERDLMDQVAELDADIRSRVDGLQQGSRQARQRVARQIQTLRQDRSRLLEALTRVRPAEATLSAEFSALSVRVDPLDGPEEIREKADYVDDARDAVTQKRERIAKLIQRAKEEAEIQRAARDLATDVALFDESLRVGRVNRAEGGGERLAAGGATGGDESGGRAESPNPAGGNGGTPVFDSGELDGHGGFQNGGAGGRDPSVPPGAGPDPTPDAPVPPGGTLSPSMLLNLPVDELASEGLPPDRLEALARELEALDRWLAERARSMRQQAERLEDPDPESDP